MAVSQNGWPAQTAAPTHKLSRITGRVLAGDVAKLFEYLVDQFHYRVEPIDLASSWGWAYRPIRGTTNTVSNHASGTAIDLNAPKHPLGKGGTFTPSQVAAIRKILSELGGVIRWGGDYARKDEMHFEINVSPQSGRVAVAATKLGIPHPESQAANSLGVINAQALPTLTFKSKGQAVGALQTKLKQLGYYPGKIDQDFGKQTESAVRAFQRANKLKDDGIVGAKTWGLLNQGAM